VQHSSLPLSEAIHRFEQQREDHRREAMLAGCSGCGAEESLAFARVERIIGLWQRLAQDLVQQASKDIVLVGSSCKKLRRTPASDRLLRGESDTAPSPEPLAAHGLSSQHGRAGFVMKQADQGFRLQDDENDPVPACPYLCLPCLPSSSFALASSNSPLIPPNATSLAELHAGGSGPGLLLAHELGRCTQRWQRGDAQVWWSHGVISW